MSAEQVDAAFADAAKSRLKGILPMPRTRSCRDIVGDPHSVIFDASLPRTEGKLVKVFGWYENEWGYTSRLLDLTG